MKKIPTIFIIILMLLFITKSRMKKNAARFENDSMRLMIWKQQIKS
jgi:hypothetical protein